MHSLWLGQELGCEKFLKIFSSGQWPVIRGQFIGIGKPSKTRRDIRKTEEWTGFTRLTRFQEKEGRRGESQENQTADERGCTPMEEDADCGFRIGDWGGLGGL